MKSEPWKDWLPGVLGKRQMQELAQVGYITDSVLDSADASASVDYSSFDLFLSNQAYELSTGSVKPSGGSYLHFIRTQRLATKLEPDQDGVFTLRRLKTYLFKLKERLNPKLVEASIYGQATAKSSVGRMDVLARLIVDGSRGYEGFQPNEVGNGDMFLEITPITFPVQVREGVSLSQLRLFYGPLNACEIKGAQLCQTTLVGQSRCGETLSVDLTPTEIGGLRGVAFVAEETESAIALWGDASADPCEYWKLAEASTNDRLTIETNRFYILRSLERMRLPSGVAVYCRAIDETIGEMRIHYAGFVHPLFGWERTDGRTGTPLIFEVRCHSLRANLLHGEVLARLNFYRMSEDAEDAKDEEGEAGVRPERSPYLEQELQLSKFFRKWPAHLERAADGTLRKRSS